MFPRSFPVACAALLGFLLPARALPPDAAATSPTGTPQPSIVYRSDEADATAQGLANQPQFSGCGIVYNGGTGTGSVMGTGTAIAANWVLTAKHVVAGYTTATFHAANGQVLTGIVSVDSATDMALIKLNQPLVTTSGQSFAPVALLTPNLPGQILPAGPKAQPVGPLVWNVGYGTYGTEGGTVNAVDLKRRGGTNVVTSSGGSLLSLTDENTSGTEFECSTAPGDDGGPMYLQTGYQWRIAGEVYSTGSSFQDTDVGYNPFLSATTGLTFAPQAAPTALTWNATYLSPSAATSKNLANFTDGSGNWDTTRLDFVGATAGGDTYTYAWQTATPLPVTCGHGSGTAGTVTVTTPINIADLLFAAPGSGAYNLTGTSANPLTLAAAGSSITVNLGVTPLISAVLTGTGALNKLGAGGLSLSGTNTYTGGTNINAGGIQIGTPGALGTSGDILLASGTDLSVDPLGSTGYTLASGRTLTDNGTITGTLSIAGTLTGTGIVGNGTGGNTVTVNAGGLVSGASGTLTVRSTITNNGTISMPAGSLLDNSAASSFTNNGVLNLTGGKAKLPQTFMNGSGGAITDTGGTLTVSGGLVNNGTIRLLGGAVFDASAVSSFTNNGVLDLIGGSAKLPPGFVNGNGGTILTSDLVRVKSTTRTSTAVTLTIDSYSGHTYQLQRAASPDAASFANLGSAQPGSTGTTLTFMDMSPPTGQGFYRVVLTP